MNKMLTYNIFNVILTTVLAMVCLGFLYHAEGVAGGVEAVSVRSRLRFSH